MSSVKLIDLTKRFGATSAVDAVSLDVAEGEFFSLLGPSGCGKSTTLRMIAGFEEVDEGAIELDGRDVSGLPPEQREIGFVFQNYAIFPHMNVFENIAFGLKVRKVPREDIARRVSAALEQVGLQGFEARKQREMSGGQQQRVALARVLVTEPRILLLDEPLSALDKSLREEMKFWIKDLQETLGITTIYVTHDQGEALTMSDRIAVMNAGSIAQIGAPREIYEQPANRFVAEFIGESNVLPATIRAVEGTVAELDANGRALRAPARPGAAVGDSVAVIVRPERLALGPPPDGDVWNQVEATVTDITYQGALVRFRFDVGGAEMIAEWPNRHDTPRLSGGASTPLCWPVDSGWMVDR